ncbi:hypothetical protein HK101_001463, partial [Irineochytrium annulatum]
EEGAAEGGYGVIDEEEDEDEDVEDDELDYEGGEFEGDEYEGEELEGSEDGDELDEEEADEDDIEADDGMEDEDVSGDESNLIDDHRHEYGVETIKEEEDGSSDHEYEEAPEEHQAESPAGVRSPNAGNARLSDVSNNSMQQSGGSPPASTPAGSTAPFNFTASPAGKTPKTPAKAKTPKTPRVSAPVLTESARKAKQFKVPAPHRRASAIPQLNRRRPPGTGVVSATPAPPKARAVADIKADPKRWRVSVGPMQAKDGFPYGFAGLGGPAPAAGPAPASARPAGGRPSISGPIPARLAGGRQSTSGGDRRQSLFGGARPSLPGGGRPSLGGGGRISLSGSSSNRRMSGYIPKEDPLVLNKVVNILGKVAPGSAEELALLSNREGGLLRSPAKPFLENF